jgi:hypothetical protein
MPTAKTTSTKLWANSTGTEAKAMAAQTAMSIASGIAAPVSLLMCVIPIESGHTWMAVYQKS